MLPETCRCVLCKQIQPERYSDGEWRVAERSAMNNRLFPRGLGADLSRLPISVDLAGPSSMSLRVALHRRTLLTSAAATLVACTVPQTLTRAAGLRSFYVATDGSDANPGTQAAPWRTITRAVEAALLPGDEIVVMPGTYTERFWMNKGGNADTAIGYVTLRSELPGQALLRPPSGTYSTLNVRANYVVIDGFDIVGGDGHAIDVEHRHHVKLLNNICHDSGGSGIGIAWSEWLAVEGNRCFRNAATNGYQCSGISIYQGRNISGDAISTGFRTIIRNNVSYQNVIRFTGNNHTDGNGIIIDDFQSTQTSGFPNYTFPTLVENNLCFSNGGKAIQITWSDYVTIRNNTCWRNNVDNQNPGTWRGELSNAQSSNNKWINNIGVADPSINSNNTAIDNTSYGGYRNAETIWHNNLTFNGTPGQASLRLDGGNLAPSAANGNLLGVNPLFVNASTSGGDFRLQTGSPAIGAGTTDFGVAPTDLAGSSRIANSIDIGAYEHGGNGSPPPEEPPPEPSPSGTSSLWGAAAVPAIVTVNDAQAVELGVRFRVTSAGFVTGIRYYKGPRNAGRHRVRLWNSSGTRLANAQASNETASGWQQVMFAEPVPVQAGVTYVASYHTTSGYYSASIDYFVANMVNGPITALGDGANGVYRYGSGGFPRDSYQRTNYWVDIVFKR